MEIDKTRRRTLPPQPLSDKPKDANLAENWLLRVAFWAGMYYSRFFSRSLKKGRAGYQPKLGLKLRRRRAEDPGVATVAPEKSPNRRADD